MKTVKNLIICVLMLVVVSQAAADTHYVGPGGSIQAAIDAAVSGDEIEVAPGTYYEAINFNGKAVRLYSTGGASVTTINGNGAYHVVQCISGETADTIIEGFRITGGNAAGSKGGGMLNLASSSPTVTNCTFSGNKARDGGGMCNHQGSNPIVTDCTFSENSGFDGGGMCNLGSNPTVTDCIFLSNAAQQHGGGIYNGSGNPDVTNCIFSGNTAGAGGGGMMNNDSSSPKVANCIFTSVNKAGAGGGMANSVNSNPIVTNCTFTSNESTNGGGMSNYHSNPTVINCVLWGNSPPQIFNYSNEVPVVTYSDVQGGTGQPWFGTGCIDADPMFADADGRLSPGSPCIDVGNNAAVPSGVTTDLDGHPRIVNNTVDMGAYEIPAKTGIKGTVIGVDSAGNVSGPLDGAEVTLIGQETATTVTDSTGNFSFLNISAGYYAVTITKSGYYDVSSEIYIEENEVLHEVFQLAAYESGSQSPVGYDFVSPGGKHFIEGTPGDISFEITVAWNGAPGYVNFYIGNDCRSATVTDLGGGLARASLTIPAPSIVNSSSKLTIEVVNGELKHTYLNTEVRFHPVPGIINSWYKDNIPWEPSDSSLSYEDGLSWSWKLPVSKDASVKASLGFKRELSYDLMSGSFDGSLGGTGGLSWDWAVAGVKLLGAGKAELDATLDVDLGDGPPYITPGWQVSFTGRLGVEVPVILVVNVIFPPAAPTINYMLTIPVVKDVVGALKVRLYLIGGASIAGIYEGGEFGDCFLGSTQVDVSGTIGVEIQAELSMGFAKVGVYAGGTGTPSFQICPDFKLNSITIYAYVGVYGDVYWFGWRRIVDQRYGCTIKIGDAGEAQALSAQLLGNALEGDVTWELASDSLKRWGPANRPVGSAIRELAFTPKAGATGSEAETIAENVIGTASPSVVSDASQTMLLFSLHDVSKPDPNASDIGTFVSTGGGAWSPGRITYDDASDFVAKIMSVGSDSYLAAWERISGDVSEVIDPDQIDQIGRHLEIAASWFDRDTGVWSALTEITDNDFVDRSPLPIVFGSTTGIVWIQNDVNYIGNSENGDRLMFSKSDGSGWGTPEELWSGPYGILSTSFASDSSNQGHIVFAVDMDGDDTTRTDRELYGISTSDGTWGAAERLTNNDVEDSCPVIVNPNGTAIVVWNSNDTLLYTPLGAEAWNPEQVYSQYTLNNQAPTLAGVTMADGAAIAYTVQSPSGMDIMASFYDAALDRWSLPRQLTFDEDAESAISVGFDGDRLIVAYLKTKTERKDVDVEIEGQMYHLENIPEPGRTDLCILHHTLGYDLSVDSSSIVLEPANPEPGSPATIRATVANSGDLGAENIAVRFYDGAPDSGGSIIGDTQIGGNLIPGGENEVSVSWDVPADSSNSHEIFAVVDPCLAVDDRDRSNNTASKFAVLPDVEVKNSWSTELSPDSVMLIARIANTGVTAATHVAVSWRIGSREGTEIGSDLIGTLACDGFYEASCVWDVDGVFDSNDYVKVFGVVSSASGVPDFDEHNNAFSLLVNNPSPEVQDTTPPEISVDAPEQYGLYSVGGVTLEFSATDAVGVSHLWGILTDAAGDAQEVDSGFVPDAGVYNLVVSARDEAGNEAQSEPVFFVVYDPTGGFVTGGGWIISPEGAYALDPSLTGKANFGFVSKYKKGANVPTGNTEFQFKAGDLNFHSSSYQWLVVTGSNYARFKGSGTINGEGDYKLMLWAGDGDPDTFRIKICTEDELGNETLIYDNGMNQAIGGGSIVVHSK